MPNDSPPGSRAQQTTVSVFEEQLSIDKRVVETGRGVRVHKTVQTQPVTIDDSLAHDEIDVRHVPVGRMLDDGDVPAARQEGDTLIVPVFEEVLVVERRLRLKEELHITRTRHQVPHAETVVLRTEQVSIERFDDAGPPAT